MKRIIHRSLLALGLLLMWPAQSKAAQPRDLFANDKEIDEICTSGKPVVFTDNTLRDLDGITQELLPGKSVKFQYLGNRRTLTGRDCNINKIINTVDVGSGQKNLQNVINDDLNDYGEFISTVKVGVAYNPMLSVKDNSCYYAKGTTAGYCIVSGSGNTVLSLDVIKVMAISFYRDGKLVETVDIQEGQDGSGVNLKLVNIPGTDEAGMCLSAVAPCAFDEISLDFSGGANVGVGNLYRIKYAYVGEAREFTITENRVNGSITATGMTSTPFQEYNPAENANVDLDYVKGWNPVLLGIPFPILDRDIAKMTNADYEDYAPLTPIVGLAYMGGTKFMMKDKADTRREVYKAGTEVGFRYKYGSGLDLSLGNTIQIILFDRNGNQVQTETISAGVLGLSVAKGGDGTSCITSTVPFSGAEIRFYGALEVNLGALGVHYAFVREQPEVRHHCPINPTADLSLCAEQTTYQLLSNPKIPVKWTLEEFIPVNAGETTSATVSAGGYVKGLDAPGQYVFRATAADGCSDVVVINFDMFPQPSEVETQGTPLVNDYGNGTYELSEYNAEDTSGGLIIIDGAENDANVIDGSYNETTGRFGLNEYATWGGLQLASNQMIIGVKRTDGLIVDFERDHEKEFYEKGTRVGFVVSSSVTGLNLSVLNFWNIRCYYQGKEVYRHVIDESNAVSAALAGTDGAKRIRYTITLPWYDKNENHMMVDEIQLWSSGLLDLSGEQLDIYYGFVEGEGEDGGNPLNCSATVVSNATTGAGIDYSLLCNASLVQALGAMDNISYIIDDDPKMETALVENHTAGVAARVTIPVNLGRTVDFRHQLGIVMRNDAYLAEVKLGSGMVVYTMYQGKKTGDEFSQWGVLGADVAGYGDKQIFYIHPKRICDEIVIDYGDGVTVAAPQFFGIFMRSDSDADGIPDCQDPCSCVSNISDIKSMDVCEGDYLEIVATGIPGNTYKVQFNDPAAGDQLQIKKAEEKTTDNITIGYRTKTPGQYQLTFYSAEDTPISSVVYYVHPLTTEWRADAASSDWNNWSNWSVGTPYCCSNVIIPSDAKTYPSLNGTNINGDEFCCNNIFIRPGASIGSVNKLNYKRAWVQMELSPDCYNLISAPLKGMVTGDMFIPEGNGIHDPETLFEPIIAAENRFNPTIYQRLWYSSALERNSSDAPAELTGLEGIGGMDFTKWSRNFNFLNTPYTSGMGFSMWVDNGNLPADTKFRFTFPKENTEYSYFDDFTHKPISPELKETSLERGAADGIGRFIYESGTPRQWNYERKDKETETRSLYDIPAEGLPSKMTARESTGHFLFGNPFMSPVDSRQFIIENKDVIKGIISYDGNVTASLVYDEAADEFTETGAVEKIAPMTAVFVIAKNDAAEMSVRLTEDMISGDGGNVESPAAKGIRIKASAGGLNSSMVALTESSVQNHVLFDNEVAPRLALFTTNIDGEACDIVSATDNIPLTVIAGNDAEIRLDFFTNGVDRDGWILLDKADGTEYPLDREIILPEGTGTTSGRFILKKVSGVSTGVGDVADDAVFVTVEGNDIVAHVAAGNFTSMEVYDMSGAKVAATRASRVHVLSGVYVVRVASEAGVSAHKVLVR